LSITVSVHHRRPLLAFIVIAVICGMVIGHTLATQAMPGLLSRPVAIVHGVVFPVAAAEPTDGLVFSPVVAADPVRVVAAVDTRPAAVRPATHARTAVRSTHWSARPGQTARTAARQQHAWGHQHGKHGKHAKHGKGHGHHGHGRPDVTLSLRWR
jgi:hypothetical protein